MSQIEIKNENVLSSCPLALGVVFGPAVVGVTTLLGVASAIPDNLPELKIGLEIIGVAFLVLQGWIWKNLRKL